MLQRQRGADLQRRQWPPPRGPDGRPTGGRYKRVFSATEDKAGESFTDLDSRIMNRAGGGFAPSYDTQPAVDQTTHIIVAAALVLHVDVLHSSSRDQLTEASRASSGCI